MTGTIEIVRLGSDAQLRDEMARDVRRGLSAKPKTLPPKYFYDEVGSRLFDRITRLPEYYLTRAETSILERDAAEIVAASSPRELVEIGGGFSRKTELLLRALAGTGARYVSLDVSEDALRGAAERLSERLPSIEFVGVVGDFQRDLLRIPRSGRRLVAFLGSTIGNLEREERADFLRDVRDMLESGDRFLLGVDLVKDVGRLEAAYDDAEGVTAEFNRNVLCVLNRELDGDLPVADFAHRAFFDVAKERIEMRLVAGRAIRARLRALDLSVGFDAGEELRTEISAKFHRTTVEAEFAAAGLALERWLTDDAGDFALALGAPLAG